MVSSPQMLNRAELWSLAQLATFWHSAITRRITADVASTVSKQGPCCYEAEISTQVNLSMKAATATEFSEYGHLPAASELS